MLARHVSDLTGPSSGAFLHTKSANTARKNAPDDGPVRSETCRANIRIE